MHLVHWLYIANAITVLVGIYPTLKSKENTWVQKKYMFTLFFYGALYLGWAFYWFFGQKVADVGAILANLLFATCFIFGGIACYLYNRSLERLNKLMSQSSE